MPLASIVIPCYRQGRFLPQAVRSALAQTVADLEVFAIDDGSPEDPFAGLGDLAGDARLHLLRQENLGLELTRNRGIELSRGEFLTFLDSDDWLDPGFLEHLIPVLQQDPALGIAYCDVEEVFEGDGLRQAKLEPYSVGRSRAVTSGDILPSLLCGGYFPPNTVLVRRSVLDAVGFFAPGLGGHADYDLWLRIAASGYPARYVGRRLAYYRVHGDNMSFRQQHMAATRRQALQRLFSRFPEAAAGAVDGLIRLTADLFYANRILQTRLVEVDGELSGLEKKRTAEAEAAAGYFQESQDWMRSLQEGLEFHAAQSSHWKAQAESLATLLREAEVANRQDAKLGAEPPDPLSGEDA